MRPHFIPAEGKNEARGILEHYGFVQKSKYNDVDEFFIPNHDYTITGNYTVHMSTNEYIPVLDDILKFIPAYADTATIGEHLITEVEIARLEQCRVVFLPKEWAFAIKAPVTHGYFKANIERGYESLFSAFEKMYFTWRGYCDGVANQSE